jgi:hypothetical protein
VTETDLFVALALLLAGVAVGILVMIWLGIKRDDGPAPRRPNRDQIPGGLAANRPVVSTLRVR